MVIHWALMQQSCQECHWPHVHPAVYGKAIITGSAAAGIVALCAIADMLWTC